MKPLPEDTHTKELTMKNLLLSLIALLSLLSPQAFANTDEVAALYHERMEQRYPTVPFEEFYRAEEDEIPSQVQELRQRQLDDMLHFARTYNLFDIGWSYANHPDVYEVTIEGGEVVAYTFSIVISKNGVPDSRRFYQGSKRVDGVFFVERISDYPLN